MIDQIWYTRQDMVCLKYYSFCRHEFIRNQIKDKHLGFNPKNPTILTFVLLRIRFTFNDIMHSKKYLSILNIKFITNCFVDESYFKILHII